jgi:hypothetical protein
MKRQLIFGLAAIAIPTLWSQNLSGRLEFSDSVRMVNCDPAATAPCFRLRFNIVDAQGAPLPAELPPPDKLAANITVRANDLAISPFFAVAGGGEARAVRGRVALVLVDISGSMNRVLPGGGSRFDGAKAALSSFLDGFENGTDQVAVVPFESHDVESTIRRAPFASSKEDALRQVQSLPVPQSHNNTGLYSAVNVGLDVLADQLKRRAASAGAPEAMLLVMTDGTNEVLKGDDAGLLEGPQGLDQVANKVIASGLQVIGVGFGDPTEIDETALRRLSTRHYMAGNAASLTRIFTFARTLLSSRIQATFTSPWADRASLAGQTLRISVQLKLPTGQQLSSDVKTWATPQMGVPLFEGRCDADEMKALVQGAGPVSNGWISVLRPVLVFTGLGVLLLVMWFGVPRLVWPEQHIGVVPTRRWGNPSGDPRKPVRPPPPGFDPGAAGHQPSRAPTDATVVMPVPDFTKTRLEPPGGPRK